MAAVLNPPRATSQESTELAERLLDYEPRVAIVVPVLGRPERIAPMIESFQGIDWKKKALWFVANGDDDATLDVLVHLTFEMPRYEGDVAYTVIGSREPGDYARKINDWVRRVAPMVGRPDWILTGADDLSFDSECIDEMLLTSEVAGKRVIGTNDQANPAVMAGRHSTHTFVHWSYIEEDPGPTFTDGPGVVLHEGYDHQYVDTEMLAVARHRGEWAFSERCLIRHHHPMFDRSAQRDATYDLALAQSRQDALLHRRRLLVWRKAQRQGRGRR